jgi:hypothetical protein
LLLFSDVLVVMRITVDCGLDAPSVWTLALVVERFNDKSLIVTNLLKRLGQPSSSSSSETLRRQRH